MNQKHDHKSLPQPTSREAITRRRIKQFNERLQERPELLAQFESILALATETGPDGHFRTADEVEALVVEALRKLGQQTMQQWAGEAQVRAVEDCRQEHPTARVKKKSPLSWWCVYGEVRLEELTLRTAKLHALRPFARRARVSCRGKSARLQRAMTDFGSEKSFASANRQLLEHYGFGLHASALRAATLQHAQRAEQMLRFEYEQPYRILPVKGTEVAPVIVAEADGSMLCTVPEGRARKGARPRQWQEIRLLAAQPQGRVQATYAATFASVQEAGQRWAHTARQAGRALESRIHAVGDGAEWIALQARAVFGTDATLLTDYYHVSEYLAAAAPACRPAAPEPWRRTQQKRLLRGASAQVIEELAGQREAPAVSEENAPVRAAHRYLSNRPNTLDYPAALAAGLPIGSGLIESGHKHVLQARLKLPGCAWLKSNAESIAQLRVLRSNDRWSDLWPLAA